jgi:hypothetical protein
LGLEHEGSENPGFGRSCFESFLRDKFGELDAELERKLEVEELEEA